MVGIALAPYISSLAVIFVAISLAFDNLAIALKMRMAA
jgi:hypothetical protein